MSYPTGTILARDTPKDNKYDRVSVVGPSPISHASAGEWAGHGGDAIIVQPVGEFGPPEIMPIRAAAEEYSIEFEPDPAPTHIESAQGGRATRQLAPEEQFRAAAKRGGDSPSEREKTPIKHRR